MHRDIVRFRMNPSRDGALTQLLTCSGDMLANLQTVGLPQWSAYVVSSKRLRMVLCALTCTVFVIVAWTSIDAEGWSRHRETLEGAWRYTTSVVSPPKPVDWCHLPGTDPAILRGGLPGFYVIENVWFNGDTFYMFTPEPESFPDKDRVLSGPFGWEVRPEEDIHEFVVASRSVCLDGNNLLLADHPDWGVEGQWTGYGHYYHLFGEGFIGGVAALEAALEPIIDLSDPEQGESLWIEPYKNLTVGSRTKSEDYTWERKPHKGVEFDRIVIPWEDGWRDQHGINEFLLDHMYGRNIVEPDEWERWRAAGTWVSFQRVVIADRWAAARYSPPVEGWHRQSLSALGLPFSHLFFEPTRRSLLEALRTPVHQRPEFGKALGHIPRILYVDRQASYRKLEDEAHTALMGILDRLEEDGKAVVRHVKWETLSKRKQVDDCTDVDIYLGVHGNGMTHQLWMPPGGKTIEIFPMDTFTRDYQIIAEYLGHEHHLIWNDRDVPQTEWDEGFAHPYNAIWNGIPIPLDTDFIRGLLEELVESMTNPPS